MGMADTVTKEYIRSNEVFADAFNYLIYDGEQVVKPALLKEPDTTEIAIPFSLGENENQTEEFVQDYRIFLIDPYKLANNDLEKFSTSLGDVLGYIKYSKDKKALSKFLNDKQVMIMDNDAARVIRDVTNTPIYVPDGKGEIDMCKAVRDMIDESKQEGMAAGELNKAKKMALKMYQKGDSIEEIAEMAEFSVDQVKEWINSAV